MTFTEYPQIEQGSEEWFDQRRGIVTASIVGHLITQRTLSAKDYDCPNCAAPANEPCKSARSGAPIKTLHTERAAVARDTPSAPILEPASNDTSRGITELLAAERITGRTDPTPLTDAMWRGKLDEPYARDVYRDYYTEVRETGFMVRDDWGFRIGYSPDGVVGIDGLIEIKSRSQKKQLHTILAGLPPIETMAQMQTGLLVSGRKWCDYVSYRGGMHLWVHRVYPDRRWFDVIVDTVRRFEANAQEIQRRYDELVEGLPLTEYIEPGQEIVL